MYVGMNHDRVKMSHLQTRVPHVRGDEPQVAQSTEIEEVRSPCTWG